MSNITKKAFPVLNMHCAGCANNVEKTVKKLAGVVRQHRSTSPQTHCPFRTRPTS